MQGETRFLEREVRATAVPLGVFGGGMIGEDRLHVRARPFVAVEHGGLRVRGLALGHFALEAGHPGEERVRFGRLQLRLPHPAVVD